VGYGSRGFGRRPAEDNPARPPLPDHGAGLRPSARWPRGRQNRPPSIIVRVEAGLSGPAAAGLLNDRRTGDNPLMASNASHMPILSP
jgi:hypothetical protein